MSTSGKILATSISIAALVALAISSYLTWISWQQGTVVGCTADAAFDCDTVLSSHWSRWLGLPVAALGSLVYLGVLIVAWPATFRPRGAAMAALCGLSLVAVAAALWFVGLQVFQLQSFCWYCLMVHGCGLVIGTLCLALYVSYDPAMPSEAARSVVGVGQSAIPSLVADRAADDSSAGAVVAVVVALLGVAALVGGQLLLPSDDSMALEEIDLKSVANRLSEPAENGELSTEPNVELDDDETAPDFMVNEPVDRSAGQSEYSAADRLLSFAALPRPLDPTSVPVIGSPEAEHVIVEMLDYTCSHCRQLHPRLVAARERYGNRFAIALYHAPLSSECNDHLPPGKKGRPSACEYAQLAISVWKIAPEQFEEYHNWLMEGRLPPNVQTARKRAINLAGDAILLDNKLKASITSRLRKQCDAWHSIDEGLPLLLFEDSAVRGGGKNDEQLFTLLEEKTGIQPKDAN